MRNYKCDPLMMGQRLKELRRNAKNSMSQLAFAEEIGTCLGNISSEGFADGILIANMQFISTLVVHSVQKSASII